MPFLPRERRAGRDSDLCASITSHLELHVSEAGKENGTFFSVLMQRAARDHTAQKQLWAADTEAKGSEEGTPQLPAQPSLRRSYLCKNICLKLKYAVPSARGASLADLGLGADLLAGSHAGCQDGDAAAEAPTSRS